MCCPATHALLLFLHSGSEDVQSYNPPSGPPGSDSQKELQYTVSCSEFPLAHEALSPCTSCPQMRERHKAKETSLSHSSSIFKEHVAMCSASQTRLSIILTHTLSLSDGVMGRQVHESNFAS